jgi:hypothetical protein
MQEANRTAPDAWKGRSNAGSNPSADAVAITAAESRADEAELLRLLRIAAEKRAASLRINGVDYLIGILEGRLPRFTCEELKGIAAAQETVR